MTACTSSPPSLSLPLLSVPASASSPSHSVMAMPAPPAHRRNKSASVLKGIILPRSHKRSPSDGTALESNPPASHPYSLASPPMLPPDHPDARPRGHTRTKTLPAAPEDSPRKSQDTRRSPIKSLHKKTLSSVSLRSLGRSQDKERSKDSRSREPSRTRKEGKDDMEKSPKKAKSRSNLASLFSKSKPSQDARETMVYDKENTTPPATPGRVTAHTPIWAQYSSQPLQDITTTTRVPLNDERRSIEDEIALYTPVDYSPSKGRNFFEYGQPSLQKKSPVKERPRSAYLPSGTSLLETLTRKKSDDRVPLGDTKGNGGRVKENISSKSIASKPVLSRRSTDQPRVTTSPKKEPESPRKQSRVMAAVAAFNGRSKESGKMGPPASPTKADSKLDPKVVDAEFEEVLVCLPSS